MRLIRHSTFETNSSSCHSISISNTVDLYETIVPNDNGQIIFNGGEFGWGYQEYNDAKTKANYVAVSLKLYEADGLETFEKIIKEHTGADEIIYNFSEDGSTNWSYIDHQSTQQLFDYSDYDSLKNFIFNPESVLFIDNDNRDSFNLAEENVYTVELSNEPYTFGVDLKYVERERLRIGQSAEFVWVDEEVYSDQISKLEFLAGLIKVSRNKEYTKVFEDVLKEIYNVKYVGYDFMIDYGSHLPDLHYIKHPFFNYTNPDMIKNFIFNPKSTLSIKENF